MTRRVGETCVHPSSTSSSAHTHCSISGRREKGADRRHVEKCPGPARPLLLLLIDHKLKRSSPPLLTTPFSQETFFEHQLFSRPCDWHKGYRAKAQKQSPRGSAPGWGHRREQTWGRNKDGAWPATRAAGQAHLWGVDTYAHL